MICNEDLTITLTGSISATDIWNISRGVSSLVLQSCRSTNWKGTIKEMASLSNLSALTLLNCDQINIICQELPNYLYSLTSLHIGSWTCLSG